MNRNAIAMLIAISVFMEGYQRTKPQISLSVSSESGGPAKGLSVERRNGTISLVVFASASGGFGGTITGSIGVAEPVNGDHIELSKGFQAIEFPFKLAAGETTASTCKPPGNNCFTIATSASNERAGDLTYTVTITPSARYSLTDASVKQVTITVK
jgi:hypothetical protein